MRTMSVKKLTLVYSWEKYQWLIAYDKANDMADSSFTNRLHWQGTRRGRRILGLVLWHHLDCPLGTAMLQE